MAAVSSTSHRRGTCDACGRVRKLHRVLKSELKYHSFCRECAPKMNSIEDVKLARNRRPAKKRYKKAYPCIGGALDGEYAATEDFYSDGMYRHLSDSYVEYNLGHRTRSAPSMIFVDRSLLKPVISAAKR